MDERTSAVWAALGALTYAEALALGEIFRAAWESVGPFEQTDVAEWAFLMNAAREIAESRALEKAGA